MQVVSYTLAYLEKKELQAVDVLFLNIHFLYNILSEFVHIVALKFIIGLLVKIWDCKPQKEHEIHGSTEVRVSK